MVKSVLKVIAIFIIGTVGGIFADQILWPYFVERPLFLEYRLEQSPVYVTETNQVFIQENTALQDAIERVNKVVVGLRTETKTGKILEGSGLIVTSDGLVVTLADFLPEGSQTTLFFDSKELAPQVLQIKDDLALLKIKEENLPTIGFADFGKTKLGQRVFLVGVIFEKLGHQRVVNEGIIKYFDKDSIQTNISEREDLEGSVLFNIEGNILGLNTIDQEGKVRALSILKIKEFLGF